MANWYHCSLLVEGDVGSIISFQYRTMDEESHLNFARLGNEVDHVEWADTSSVEFSHKKGLMYYFSMIRRPCIDFVEKASILFPSLTFTLKFFEGLNGYSGKLVMKNSEELEWEYETINFQIQDEEESEEDTKYNNNHPCDEPHPLSVDISYKEPTLIDYFPCEEDNPFDEYNIYSEQPIK